MVTVSAELYTRLRYLYRLSRRNSVTVLLTFHHYILSVICFRFLRQSVLVPFQILFVDVFYRRRQPHRIRRLRQCLVQIVKQVYLSCEYASSISPLTTRVAQQYTRHCKQLVKRSDFDSLFYRIQRRNRLQIHFLQGRIVVSSRHVHRQFV